MKQKRFTVEQIVAVLKHAEAGVPMAELQGGVPIALGTGNGSELRRPLGIAIVGGLIFSQMLTL